MDDIRLLVLDVDGTLTDGGLYLDATGNELKKFSVRARVRPAPRASR